MKKLFLLLSLFFCLVFAGTALADFQITASWIASTGPDLAYEELQVDGNVIYTAQAGESTAFIWTAAALNGELVTVTSYNSQGVPCETPLVLGNLVSVPPNSATGGSLLILWQ